MTTYHLFAADAEGNKNVGCDISLPDDKAAMMLTNEVCQGVCFTIWQGTRLVGSFETSSNFVPDVHVFDEADRKVQDQDKAWKAYAFARKMMDLTKPRTCS